MIFHVLPRWKYAAASMKADVDQQSDVIYVMCQSHVVFLELCSDKVSKRV